MNRLPAPGQASPPAMLPQSFVSPGLSMGQLWVILWDYRKAIGITILATMVLTAVVSKLLPKTYQATATVIIDFAVNDPLTSKQEFPSALAPSYMATQIEFINSPETLLPVVDQLDLTHNKVFAGGYTGAEGGLREYAMTRLAAHLTVHQATTSRFIDIDCAMNDPQSAAHIADTVAQVYVEQQIKRATAPAHARAQEYNDQLESLRKQVDVAQEKVTEFREKTGLIDMQDKVNVDTERLTDLQVRLNEAQSQRRDAMQRSAHSGEADSRVLDSGLVQTLKGDLASKEAELAQMSSVLGSRHPDYIALQAEIAADRQRLQREEGAYSGNARAELGSSQTIEREVQADFDAQRKKVLETRRLQDEGSRYQRELETATTVYHKALEGYDQVLLGQRSQYSSASIASPAAIPLLPSKPKTTVNVILGFFAGAFFGIVGSFLFEFRNRRVRCREDVEADLGLPVLAEFGGAVAARVRLSPRTPA